MPKPPLIKDDAILEHDLIQSLIAGLHEWRSDLSYPESYSDWQACVRGILKMFEVQRRPVAAPLRIECGLCRGIGELRHKEPNQILYVTSCSDCDGRGYIFGK